MEKQITVCLKGFHQEDMKNILLRVNIYVRDRVM